MADYVIPLDISRQIADTLTVAVDGLFDGAKVRLYINDLVPGPGTVLADLTPAAFTGAGTGVAIVWNDAIIGADGLIHLTAPSAFWTATATPAPGETVYGSYVIGDPAGTPFLIAAWRFDVPVQVTVKYDGVVADIDLVII